MSAACALVRATEAFHKGGEGIGLSGKARGRYAARRQAEPDELLKLIDEDPSISILVLAAATGPKGPGPLVTEFTGKLVGRLRIPVTIVPGNLSLEAIENIA